MLNYGKPVMGLPLCQTELDEGLGDLDDVGSPPKGRRLSSSLIECVKGCLLLQSLTGRCVSVMLINIATGEPSQAITPLTILIDITR